MSWFRGPFKNFVERCRQSFAAGVRSKHLVWPPLVRINGDRAVAETSIAILVRQSIDGVAVISRRRAGFSTGSNAASAG